MEIHDTFQDLPPLRRKKNKGQEKIENDTSVKNLIDTKLLLNFNFYKLYSVIAIRSREILDIIEYLNFTGKRSEYDILDEESLFSNEIAKRARKEISSYLMLREEIQTINRMVVKSEEVIKLHEKYVNEITQRIYEEKFEMEELEDKHEFLGFHYLVLKDQQFEEHVKESSLKKFQENYQNISDELKTKKNILEKLNDSKKADKAHIKKEKEEKKRSLSKKEDITVKLREKGRGTYGILLNEMFTASAAIQREINKFETKMNLDLEILTNTIVYSCSNCGYPLFFGRFRQTICKCGEKIDAIKKTDHNVIHHFNNELINFIGKNLWLEYGVDYLLKRKDFETWVGFNILGHSGVWHEIDNIAEYKNVKSKFRVFCECKSGNLGSNDILVFSGKMADIGCSRGIIFTTLTERRISPEIFRLANSNNIDIITNLFEKDIEELLEEIKE